MSTYYRVSDGALRELTPAQFAALAPSKRTDLRLYVVDPRPTPGANQTVVETGLVVGPVEAHLTYGLRALTAAEIERSSLDQERAQVDTILADIVAQRAVDRTTWDGYTAAQLRAEQWRDRQVLLRLANFLARRVKQELVL
jgi:hypothetical protein